MSTIAQNFNKTILKSTNNYTLCMLNNTCVDDAGIPVDPTIGPIDGITDLNTRTVGITFETIYKNIASYPNSIDMTNKKYITKVFYLGNNKQINVTVNMLTEGKIVTTISGDTGYEKNLIKTILITDNIKIDTVYTYE